MENDNRSCLKNDFALAHRILAYEAMHEGTWTHLSVLVPEAEDLIYVTPGNMHFSSIVPDDIITMDSEGAVIDGSATPNSAAWCLHYPLHTERRDAVCVIHLHSLYATALMMQKEMRLDEQGSQSAAAFYRQIAYYDSYDGVLEDTKEGYAMARALGKKSILVLRNHGYMAVGESVAIALERAYSFERACKLQLLAQASGNALNRIPDDIIAAVAEKESDFGGYFEGMKTLFVRQGR